MDSLRPGEVDFNGCDEAERYPIHYAVGRELIFGLPRNVHNEIQLEKVLDAQEYHYVADAETGATPDWKGSVSFFLTHEDVDPDMELDGMGTAVDYALNIPVALHEISNQDIRQTIDIVKVILEHERPAWGKNALEVCIKDVLRLDDVDLFQLLVSQKGDRWRTVAIDHILENRFSLLGATINGLSENIFNWFLNQTEYTVDFRCMGVEEYGELLVNAFMLAMASRSRPKVVRMRVFQRLIDDPRFDHMEPCNGETVLHMACQDRDPDFTRILLAQPRCTINDVSYQNWVPLNHAVLGNYTENIELLLKDRRLDMYQWDTAENVLGLAIDMICIAATRLLLAAGFNVNRPQARYNWWVDTAAAFNLVSYKFNPVDSERPGRFELAKMIHAAGGVLKGKYPVRGETEEETRVLQGLIDIFKKPPTLLQLSRNAIQKQLAKVHCHHGVRTLLACREKYVTVLREDYRLPATLLDHFDFKEKFGHMDGDDENERTDEEELDMSE